MRDDPWNSLRFQTCQSFNVPLYTLIYFHTYGIIIYIYISARLCSATKADTWCVWKRSGSRSRNAFKSFKCIICSRDARSVVIQSDTTYILYFISLIRSTHIYTHLRTCSLYKYIIYYIYQHAYMLYNILTLNFKAFGVTCGTCSWNSANICASRSI